MCRLLGVTNFDFSRHEKVVRNFCELARSGMTMDGDPPGHEDGWGLAFYSDGKPVVHKSGRNLLEETDRVTGVLGAAGTTPVMILHLRKSSWKDTTCTRHAHPFEYNGVAFAHNGTVYDFQRLVPDLTIPCGADALDTEVFLYHFLSSGRADLGKAFLDTVSLIKRDFRYSALNCLFSDGGRLFAYRDYSKEPDYYSLYKAFDGGSCLVASEPLDEQIRWQMMAREEFLVAEAG
jgi:predicted glutamine amidotransferase